MYHARSKLSKVLWRSALRVVREAMSVVRPFCTFLSMGSVEDPPVTAAIEGA